MILKEALDLHGERAAATSQSFDLGAFYGDYGDICQSEGWTQMNT